MGLRARSEVPNGEQLQARDSAAATSEVLAATFFDDPGSVQAVLAFA